MHGLPKITNLQFSINWLSKVGNQSVENVDIHKQVN